MNNEVLELSKWLYDRSFEPDMWAYTGDRGLFLDNSIESKMNANAAPFLTLGRALELLPNVIREGGYKYEFNMYQTCDGFVIQYASDCGAVQKDFESESSGCEGISLHLAALRLLVKVVEAGYLKGENDG